jgi:hypothetical protein
MQSDPLLITFAGTSTAKGNRLASSLVEALRDLDPGIVAARHREQSDTQDFGASLAVILGTTAVTTVANGLVAWLARNSGARIEIRRKHRLILTASDLNSQNVSKNVSQVVKALSSED